MADRMRVISVMKSPPREATAGRVGQIGYGKLLAGGVAGILPWIGSPVERPDKFDYYEPGAWPWPWSRAAALSARPMRRRRSPNRGSERKVSQTGSILSS